MTAKLSQLPPINSQIKGGFSWFTRRYLKRHFHTIAVQWEGGKELDVGPEDTYMLYANHASWWDPLVALFLSEQLFANHDLYAPIDAVAFEKYRMFGKLGFFPVEQDSVRGAKNFLRMGSQILATPGACLWLTPEGRFVDVRESDATLEPGLSHLAHRMNREVRESDLTHRLWIIPAAVEYPFWEERLPEVLVRVGEPVIISDDRDPAELPKSRAEWNEELTHRLRQNQAELARVSLARDANQFRILLGGASGSFVVYDWWRRITGTRSKDISHGEKFNQSQ